MSVSIHGTGINGFEATILLQSSGVDIVGLSDNNPSLQGKHVGDKKVLNLSTENENGFIVAAMSEQHIWKFKAKMKVMGINNWGMYFSAAFNISPYLDGNRVFQGILSSAQKVVNSFEGISRFDDCIEANKPNPVVDSILRSIGHSDAILKWIDSEIPSSTDGLHLLDSGPGLGIQSVFVKEIKPLLHIDWLEFSIRSWGWAKKCSSNILETLHSGIIEDSGFSIDRQYNYIILTEVFEHFATNPAGVMRNVHKLLKDGGKIFMTTPNYGPLWIYDSWRDMKTFSEVTDIEKYADDLFFHTYQYSKSELCEVLEEASFKILKYELSANNHHSMLLGKAD